MIEMLNNLLNACVDFFSTVLILIKDTLQLVVFLPKLLTSTSTLVVEFLPEPILYLVLLTLAVAIFYKFLGR